jgi:gliding motility-associated-like protein
VQSFSPAVSGVYSVVATNAVTGCSSTAASGTVTLTPAATPVFVLPDTICKGDLLAPFATLSVNGIPGTWSPLPDNQTTTTYTFTPDANLCARTFTATVAVKTIPVVQARFDSVLCLGDVKQLHPKAKGEGLSYLWSTGSTDSVIRISSAGTYTVTIANSCGSAGSLFNITQVVCKVYIPTAFTPNNDGLNDRFAIIGAAYVSRFKMQIFNRYGQLLFETENPFAGWDGTRKGLQQDAGNYVYRISYVNVANESFEVKGAFTLIR